MFADPAAPRHSDPIAAEQTGPTAVETESLGSDIPVCRCDAREQKQAGHYWRSRDGRGLQKSRKDNTDQGQRTRTPKPAVTACEKDHPSLVWRT